MSPLANRLALLDVPGMAALCELLAVLDGLTHRGPRCAGHDDHLECEHPTLQDLAEALRARLTDLEAQARWPAGDGGGRTPSASA